MIVVAWGPGPGMGPKAIGVTRWSTSNCHDAGHGRPPIHPGTDGLAAVFRHRLLGSRPHAAPVIGKLLK